MIQTGSLSAVGVHKRFGDVVALADATLEVRAGERVALVGESGSGKTTLLRCFNAMVTVDSGRVSVAGRPIDGVDSVQLRRGLGYAQQEGGLLPHWTVARNVALVPRLLGMQDAGARARRALELVGLPAERFAERWPRELSGGQRQRAALARALAAEPAAILLDEPFGSLDAITRRELQHAFTTLAETLGVTVLLVTHDLGEAFALAHRVAVMRGGRIDQVDDPDSLRARPRTPYVAELLERAGVA